MRGFVVAMGLLLLTACDVVGLDSAHGPVDPSTLAPLGGKERALLATAEGAMQTGSYAQAERNYEDAIAMSKGHVEAHLGLARYYLKSQQYAKAASVLELAAEWQPGHPEVNYLLGKAYLQQGKPEQALVVLERGMKANPDNADLKSGAAIAYDSLGKHKVAQELHRISINLAPARDRSAYTSNLAMSYLLDNQPKQAVQLLEPEMSKPGVSQVLRHNLALAYGLLGRDAEAQKLVNGDLSEDARKANLAEIRAYIAKHAKEPGKVKATAPIRPKL